jgi:hypothetical protein
MSCHLHDNVNINFVSSMGSAETTFVPFVASNLACFDEATTGGGLSLATRSSYQSLHSFRPLCCFDSCPTRSKSDRY